MKRLKFHEAPFGEICGLWTMLWTSERSVEICSDEEASCGLCVARRWAIVVVMVLILFNVYLITLNTSYHESGQVRLRQAAAGTQVPVDVALQRR